MGVEGCYQEEGVIDTLWFVEVFHLRSRNVIPPLTSRALFTPAMPISTFGHSLLSHGNEENGIRAHGCSKAAIKLEYCQFDNALGPAVFGSWS